MKQGVFSLAFFLIALGMNLFCEETEQDRGLFFIPLASYDYVNLEDQRLHVPGLGFAVMKGEQDVPFTEVHQQFLLMTKYQPFFFGKAPYTLLTGALPELPKVYHDIDFLFDGRWERQQILLIATASSDKPAAGGLQTIQAGLSWGYEILRYANLSFILGAVIGIGDFGIDLPNGDPLPVFPFPLVRLKFKTEWIAGFFYSGTNPNFTIAPKKEFVLLPI
ncbi:MAG: hypothetical protein LBK02_10090 [Treponema sp.]|jgi:hypothetical protein|nr:hypothetical protein [Treponema sp.]